jgi:hypothetical protein
VSLGGYKYLAVYATTFHWIWADQMKLKSDVTHTLDKLFRKVGIPKLLIPDDELVLQSGDFLRTAKKAHTDIHPIEAYTPNANRAEDNIRETKRIFRRSMADTNTPDCFWDLGQVFYVSCPCPQCHLPQHSHSTRRMSNHQAYRQHTGYFLPCRTWMV